MVGTLYDWSKKLENKRSPLTNITDRVVFALSFIKYILEVSIYMHFIHVFKTTTETI